MCSTKKERVAADFFDRNRGLARRAVELVERAPENARLLRVQLAELDLKAICASRPSSDPLARGHDDPAPPELAREQIDDTFNLPGHALMHILQHEERALVVETRSYLERALFERAQLRHEASRELPPNIVEKASEGGAVTPHVHRRLAKIGCVRGCQRALTDPGNPKQHGDAEATMCLFDAREFTGATNEDRRRCGELPTSHGYGPSSLGPARWSSTLGVRASQPFTRPVACVSDPP